MSGDVSSEVACVSSHVTEAASHPRAAHRGRAAVREWRLLPVTTLSPAWGLCRTSGSPRGIPTIIHIIFLLLLRCRLRGGYLRPPEAGCGEAPGRHRDCSRGDVCRVNVALVGRKSDANVQTGGRFSQTGKSSVETAKLGVDFVSEVHRILEFEFI